MAVTVVSLDKSCLCKLGGSNEKMLMSYAFLEAVSIWLVFFNSVLVDLLWVAVIFVFLVKNCQWKLAVTALHRNDGKIYAARPWFGQMLD